MKLKYFHNLSVRPIALMITSSVFCLTVLLTVQETQAVEAPGSLADELYELWNETHTDVGSSADIFDDNLMSDYSFPKPSDAVGALGEPGTATPHLERLYDNSGLGANPVPDAASPSVDYSRYWGYGGHGSDKDHSRHKKKHRHKKHKHKKRPSHRPGSGHGHGHDPTPPVPEPGTLIMVGIAGASGLAKLRSKVKKKK